MTRFGNPRLARLTMCLTLACLMAGTTVSAQPDAREIVERIDRLMRGDSSHGIATMEVVTEHCERPPRTPARRR